MSTTEDWGFPFPSDTGESPMKTDLVEAINNASDAVNDAIAEAGGTPPGVLVCLKRAQRELEVALSYVEPDVPEQ